MTLPTLFAVLVPAYLALIAYGVVGARRRGLAGRARAVATVVMVLLLPLAVLAALGSIGDVALLAKWSAVTLAMLGFGIVTALLTEIIARRTMP
jgi:hypothetical protein